MGKKEQFTEDIKNFLESNLDCLMNIKNIYTLCSSNPIFSNLPKAKNVVKYTQNINWKFITERKKIGKRLSQRLF